MATVRSTGDRPRLGSAASVAVVWPTSSTSTSTSTWSFDEKWRYAVGAETPAPRRDPAHADGLVAALRGERLRRVEKAVPGRGLRCRQRPDDDLGAARHRLDPTGCRVSQRIGTCA